MACPRGARCLNAEARDILLIAIETGCRQTGIHDFSSDGIVLDANIPHLGIALEEGNERREIKNTASARRVPLVGVALAAAESFFQLLKRERIRRQTYATRYAARQDVFDYIDMFYNPKRKHTNNGMLSPVNFEAQQQKLNEAGV